MATSTDMINDLIAGYTDLKAYFEGQQGTWDDEVAAAQAAYNALANNLKTTVANELYYIATVDPDEVAPTNVRGGTFVTIKEAIEAAPRSALVVLTLFSDKTYPVTDVISVSNKTVRFNKSGGGANPQIQTSMSVLNNENVLRAFTHDGGARYVFRDVDLMLPTALADGGLPVSTTRLSVFEYSLGLPVFCAFYNSVISGGFGGASLGLANNHGAAQSHLGLYQATLDGPFSGIVNAASGVSVVAAQSTTLLNGAALHSGGTLGTDLLQS